MMNDEYCVVAENQNNVLHLPNYDYKQTMP